MENTSNQRMHLKKKILIIGATSGIGKALAVAYAKSGNIVGVTGRRVELLSQLHDSFPQNILYAEHDIRGANNQEIFDELVKRMDGLDILIVSSGVGFENDDFEWNLEKQTIDVNVVGYSEILNIGYRHFLKQTFGHIVGISSIAAIRGIDACPAYSASKAYISNYLEAIRKKAKKRKVKILVTEIMPGFVDTEMAKGEGLFWVAPVEKAAVQIMQAIDNRKIIAYITRRWKLIAFLLKFIPRTIYDRI
jgi:short-subunit dehydrogenase